MTRKSALLLLCLALLLSVMAGAQTTAQGAPGSSSTTQSPTDQPQERRIGDYIVTQSIELGFRFTDVSTTHASATDPGSMLMYNTLVNLQQGPRLLDQTLTMRSPGHNGVLFDDLSLSSFGWGGDPNNAARLRLSKSKIYNFNLSFRRDRNFFDYNLLANPFNPPNTPLQVFISPHSFETTRRMTDVNLTLAPQSKISVRLGYNHNINEGPSWSTFHEGTDVLLFQPFRGVNDSFQFGLDFKPGARTVISYDQFYQHFKSDTSWVDNFFPWTLSNGTPADLGLPFFGTSYPCAAPFAPAPPIASSTCNVYLAYNRVNPYKTKTPTEQLSLHSNAIRKLDIIARALYSKADMSGDFMDFFNGLVTRTSERQFTFFGPQSASRTSVTADLGVTFHITDNFRISDSFRFYRFSIPSFFNEGEQAWTGTDALIPVTGPPTSADQNLISNFLGENTKMNLVTVEYDFTRYLGAYIGYRFRRSLYDQRAFNFNVPTGVLDSGEDIIPVDSHSGLFGFYLRPSRMFRANFDAELMNSDNYLTRISPRRAWEYRIRVEHRPKDWANISAFATFWEPRNGIADIRYNAHSRNVGTNITLTKNRFGFDLAYNYNNVASNSFMCFNTAAANPTAILPADIGPCAVIPEGSQSPFETYQFYHYTEHFGDASISFKPVTRVGINLGYSIDSTNGNFTQLNNLVPFGLLKSNYTQPLAGLEIEMAKGFWGFFRWNYYDYNEKTPFFGPTSPRDFHANLSTIGIRYAF